MKLGSIRKRYVIVFCLVSALIASFITYSFAGSISNTLTLSAGVYPGAATYTIYPYGTNYFAKDQNGIVDYSGASATTVFQSVLTALGSSGGEVRFETGTYDFGGNTLTASPPLTIKGEGAASVLQDITLTVTGAGAWGQIFNVENVQFTGAAEQLIIEDCIQPIVTKCYFYRSAFVADTPVLQLTSCVSAKVTQNNFEVYQMQSIEIDGAATYGTPTHWIAYNDFGSTTGTLDAWSDPWENSAIYISNAAQDDNWILYNTGYRRTDQFFLYSVANQEHIIGNKLSGGGTGATNGYVIDILGYKTDISHNIISAENTADGAIRIRGGADTEYNSITENHINGAGITLGANINNVLNNKMVTATNGIDIGGTVRNNIIGNEFVGIGGTEYFVTGTGGGYNKIVDNYMYNCAGVTGSTAYGNDAFSCVDVPFVVGTANTVHGWEIDGAGEYASCFFQVPYECQYPVKMLIYAYSNIAETDAMNLNVTIKAAAQNEPYATNTYTAVVASLPTNFASGDVVYWAVTDSSVLALRGGDSVEVTVYYAAAGGADAATDADIRALVWDYA